MTRNGFDVFCVRIKFCFLFRSLSFVVVLFVGDSIAYIVAVHNTTHSRPDMKCRRVEYWQTQRLTKTLLKIETKLMSADIHSRFKFTNYGIAFQYRSLFPSDNKIVFSVNSFDEKQCVPWRSREQYQLLLTNSLIYERRIKIRSKIN